MPYSSVVISSGHGKFVPGATGILVEVEEAWRVADTIAEMLVDRGVETWAFHDDVSTTQDENLAAIVGFHNAHDRELDVSIHFNAYQPTDKPMGTEVLYVTQEPLAREVAGAIANCGFLNRGSKYRDDLYFLVETTKPAILIEVCFVDSAADAEVYRAQFTPLCAAIADVLGGEAQA